MTKEFNSCGRNSELVLRACLEDYPELHLSSNIGDLSTLKDFINRYFIFCDKMDQLRSNNSESNILDDEIKEYSANELLESLGNINNDGDIQRIQALYKTLLKDVETLKYQPLNAETKQLIIEKQTQISVIKSKFQGTPFHKYSLDSYIYPNVTTVIDSKYVSTDTVKNTNNLVTFSELLYSLKQGFPYENMKKAPHVYNNNINIRSNITIPSTNDRDYRGWNGLLVIDIDLKYDPSFRSLNPEQQINKANEYINYLKRDIGCNTWVLAIKPSNSGKGIHIYTKVTKPFINHRGTDVMPSPEIINIDFFNQFTFNYFHKSSIVYYLLEQYGVDIKASQRGETYQETKVITDKNGKGIDTKQVTKQYGEVVDLHTISPSQGINIAPKPSTYINPCFIDDYFQTSLNETITCNGVEVSYTEYLLNNEYMLNSIVESVDKAICNIPSLNDNSVKQEKVKKLNSNKTLKNGGKDFKLDDNILLDCGVFDVVNAPKRYDIRYSVCNTIAYLCPLDKDYAYNLCLHLLQSKDGDPLSDKQKEIKAFLNTAYSSKKEPSNWVMDQLKKKGYTIGLKEGVSVEDVKKDALDVAIETLNHATIEVNNNTTMDIPLNKLIKLNKGEYLTDKKDILLSSLNSDKLNYIESGAGTGKTHLFKTLAKDKTVCLVLPFTSIIESKILSDKTITEYFKCYYGTGKEDDIKDVDGTFNACMTFDKFTKLDNPTINQFDYVVIDEAHLLFESEYRSRICAMLLDNTINLFKYTKNNDKVHDVMNCNINDMHCSFNIDNIVMPKMKASYSKKCNLIFMSGTPSEETKFYLNKNLLNYIKVDSTSLYKKDATIIMCQDEESKNTHFINKLSDNIEKGIKNIVITNKGVDYQRFIEKIINVRLNKEIKTEYFKRSNKDNDINKDIMFNGQYPANLDILFASPYLSVGVDIENSTERFNIFYPYNESTGEDIEQFNNRLRKTNKECYIYETACNGIEPKEYIKDYNTLINKRFNITDVIKNNDKNIFEESLNNSGLFFNKSNSGLFCLKDHKNHIRESDSLIELYKYAPRSKAKKNMYYITNTLKFKYMYNIDIEKNEHKNDNLIKLMVELRKVMTEQKNNIMKRIVLFLFGVDNLNEYKDYNIQENKEVECIDIVNDEIHINPEYSHYIKGKDISIIHIVEVLKDHYDINTVKDAILDEYVTLSSLNNLIKHIGFVDQLDSKDNAEGRRQDIEIKRIVDEKLGNNKLMMFDPKMEDASNKAIKDASKKLFDAYKKDILNRISRTCNGVDLTNDDINSDHLMKNIDKVLKIMFVKTQPKGVLTYNLRLLPEFDSDRYINDDVFDDATNISVEKDQLKDKILGKMTKQGKTRLVKRLLKAYLKVNELPTISNTVKALKNDYMGEAGEELTRRIFETEYKQLYIKNKKDQITGLK